MVSVDEARTLIANIRNQLRVNIGKRDWPQVLADVGTMEAYITALPVEKEDFERIDKQLEEIKSAIDYKDANACYGAFLALNTVLIQEFNILPLID